MCGLHRIPVGSEKFDQEGINLERGLFHVLGGRLEGSGKRPIVIAADLGSAAAPHQAGKLPVVCAMTPDNVEAVARALRRRHKGRRLVIAASDAPAAGAGPGPARRAAKALKARLLVPPLSEAERKAGLATFGELARAGGQMAIARAVSDAAGSKGREKKKKPGRAKAGPTKTDGIEPV